MANGGLEEGEIGNDTPTSSTPTSATWPPAYGPPPSRGVLPPPSRALAAPIPFVDTSVPPPSLSGYAPPPLYPVTQPPPAAGGYGLAAPSGPYDAYSVAAAYPPLVPPAPPPPVPILNPELAAGTYGSHLTQPGRAVGPMGDHGTEKYSGSGGRPGRREERSYSRERDRYEKRKGF
jgi:hypothetical protein